MRCRCPADGSRYCETCEAYAARAGVPLRASSPARTIYETQVATERNLVDPGANNSHRQGRFVSLALTVPIRLMSESNQREHWAAHHRRAKAQRRAVYTALHRFPWVVVQTALPLPLTVTLTRIAPRALDSDNLVASVKACQDGVADWFCGLPGRGNDRLPGLTWCYAQRKGKPNEYALDIQIATSD